MEEEYVYYCAYFKEDFVSPNEEVLCTQCLGDNIVKLG